MLSIPWPGPDNGWRPRVGEPYNIPGLGSLSDYAGEALAQATGYVVYYIGPLVVDLLPYIVAFGLVLFFVDWLLDKVIDMLPGVEVPLPTVTGGYGGTLQGGPTAYVGDDGRARSTYRFRRGA